MKKKIIVFLSFCLLNPLTSCNKEKLMVAEKLEDIDCTYSAIDVTTLNNMRSSKQSFILITYDTSCLCSIDFYNNIWNPIITEYQLLTYKISQSDFSSITSFDFVANTPEIIIFKDGEVIAHESAYDKWKNDVNNKNKVIKYLKKYCYLESPLIDITTDSLDQKIANQETFICYFKYNACNDCNTFNTLYFNSFLKNSKNKNLKIYAIESGMYRDDEGTWELVKEKYGLTSSSTYGYGEGVVPTFQVYNQGILSYSAIIYNDELTYSEENNCYTITDGFYSDNIGKTYSSRDDYYNSTLKFFKNKLSDLITYYQSL